jgi:hypothetical protein
MKSVLRTVLGLVFAFALFGASDALAIDKCENCKVYFYGGTNSISCVRPDMGQMGFRYCFIEDDGEHAYCFTAGDFCCVTGPAY